MAAPERERFDAKWLGEPNSGCWLWMANADQYGYGMFRRSIANGGNWMHASRVAYELFVGRIPLGNYICHKCDTPACVNPNHLYAGTQLDNMADVRRRGRRVAARGEASGKSKLTSEQVAEIRSSPQPHDVMAAAYGVSKSAVARIRQGITWRDEMSEPWKATHIPSVRLPRKGSRRSLLAERKLVTS